jgi:hypothetical protein
MISTDSSKYFWIWEKYRPVLLKLMKDSANDSQSYQLSPHEFQDVNNKKSTGYSFNLKAYQGKILGKSAKNAIAKDMMQVLVQSETAKGLMENMTYEFKMDKNFVLTVTEIPDKTK